MACKRSRTFGWVCKHEVYAVVGKGWRKGRKERHRFGSIFFKHWVKPRVWGSQSQILDRYKSSVSHMSGLSRSESWPDSTFLALMWSSTNYTEASKQVLEECQSSAWRLNIVEGIMGPGAISALVAVERDGSLRVKKTKARVYQESN